MKNKEISKNEFKEACNKIIKIIDILEQIFDNSFLDNHFDITNRIIITDNDMKFKDINKCNFKLKDLIKYICYLSTEYLQTYISNNDKPETLKNNLLNFTGYNLVRFFELREEFDYQVSSEDIKFTVKYFYDLLECYKRVCVNKLKTI